VTSDPGFGSVFTLRVPRDPAQVKATPQRPIRPRCCPRGGSARRRPERAKPLALVIDDDPASTELMNRMLERAGYTVETAQNGHTGMAHAMALGPI
jgi:PleD family two-component response regulator